MAFDYTQLRSKDHFLWQVCLHHANLKHSNVLKFESLGFNVINAQLHNNVEITSFGSINLRPPTSFEYNNVFN
jgi:hypothetical protein